MREKRGRKGERRGGKEGKNRAFENFRTYKYFRGRDFKSGSGVPAKLFWHKSLKKLEGGKKGKKKTLKNEEIKQSKVRNVVLISLQIGQIF